MASASYVPAVFERGFPYGFPLYVYGNLTASLARARVATVVLVAGAHVALPSYRHSARYVQAVAAVFRDAGFETRLRLGQHPDEDFAYMAQARCFVSGGGGFSQTIAELVRRNGGATHLTRPDEAAGASFLASGSAAPEIMINFAATRRRKVDLSVSAIMGSAIIAFGRIKHTKHIPASG